ncbi:MAG: choice-of-anchor Q domain-containing protein [Opitutaceae bacterium]
MSLFIRYSLGILSRILVFLSASTLKLVLPLLLVLLTILHGNAATVTSTSSNGPGSLRQAVGNAVAGDTIDFDASLSGAVITLSSRINIGTSVTIDASSLPEGLTISGGGVTQVFFNQGGVATTLTKLTIRDGKAPNGATGSNGAVGDDGSNGIIGGGGFSGGAIFNSGNLTLQFCSLINNSAGNGGNGGVGGTGIDFFLAVPTGNGGDGGPGGAGGDGGAIYNSASGQLSLDSCTFALNTAGTGGSGGAEGFGNFSNGNRGQGGIGGSGGAVYNLGSLSLSSSTLSLNEIGLGGSGISQGSSGTGGGIFSSGTASSGNSLIANNCVVHSSLSPDVSGTFSSQSNNLIGDSTGSSGWSIGPGDVLGYVANPLDPVLAPLGDYGGTTETMPPLRGSPALDAGSSIQSVDQRGFARTFGAAVDIGAVESNLDMVVTSLSASGAGTLTTAVQQGLIPETSISFDPSLSGGVITLAAPIVINESMTIDGSGLADGITISGGNSVGVFEVESGGNVSLIDFTIANGNANSGAGLFNQGVVTIAGCTFSNNLASSRGGAIFNSSGILTLENCTLAGNSSGLEGGAILNSGLLTLSHCTIADNTANGYISGPNSTGAVFSAIYLSLSRIRSSLEITRQMLQTLEDRGVFL